jgi:hypothetical protein
MLFGALALFLIMGGAVGELIYATGDVDLVEYSQLLATERTEVLRISRGTSSREPADA